MAYVIKIKYENSLRRLTLQKNELGEEGLSFAKFEGRIRDLFQLPPTANLGLTYTDTENDVVTMATDQDVQDALVHQSLNPLRVFVTLVDRKSDPASGSSKVEKSIVNETEDLVKKLLRNLSTNSEAVKKAVQLYEPLFEGVSSSPAQASALVEKLVATISAQVAAAVKQGADVAALTKSFGFGPSTLPGLSSGKSSSAPETSSRSSDAFNAAAAAAAAAGMAEAVKNGASLFADVFNAADGDARKAEATKEGVDPVVHHAVGCDVCGVNPIVGVRWKSNKKYDYDLCSRCFKDHGKESDFTKIEHSMFRPRHLHNPHGHHRMPMGPPFVPMGPSFGHGGRPFAMSGRHFGGRFQCGPMGAGGGKLDARFVCDVTMFDGTEVVPGTRFTKIWRLRNSGSVPWPARTNLVHVGGDELGQLPLVPLEISAEGLAPEAEMEAAVDLVAPEKPGRYVSHWRLASPAGPKFGHRIWVVIQVVSNESTDRAVEQEPVKENTPVQTPESGIDVQDDVAPEVAPAKSDLELTTQQVAVAKSADFSGENKAGQVVTVRLEPTISFVKVEVPIPDVEGEVEAVPLTEDTKLAENGLAAEDSAVERDLGEGFSMVYADGVVKNDEEPITYPVLDVTRDQGPIAYPVVEPAVADNVEPAVAEDVESAVAEDVKPAVAENVELAVADNVEPAVAGKANEAVPAAEVDLSTPSALLGKLEVMGFTDSKLNLELLEKNNLDLRKTLDDLCAVEEWDPILEELEEMGFYDADMNRRLMFKNNGSVKRVVKELVQMYRDLQGKGKSVE